MQSTVKIKIFWTFITYIAFTSALLILILIFAHESKASEDLLGMYVKTDKIEYQENEPVNIIIQNTKDAGVNAENSNIIKSFEVVEEGDDFVFFDISFNSSNIPDDDQLFVSAITLTDGKSLGYWGSTNAHVQKGTASRIRIGMGPDSPSYCSDEIKIQVYSEEKSFESFIAPYKKCWQRSTVVFQKPSFFKKIKKLFTLSKKQAIGNWYVNTIPISAMVVSGSVPSKEWLNVDRFPISLNDALTSSPISDAGFANIAKDTVIDFVFEDSIVNNADADLLLIETRFDPGDYKISTDYDNFTSSIDITANSFIDSGISHMYHYGAYPNRGPFKATVFASSIDLSTLGVPDNEKVSIIRVAVISDNGDLLGIGKLSSNTDHYFFSDMLLMLILVVLIVGILKIVHHKNRKVSVYHE